MRLTHLGAAGWEITDGQRVILMDPYLSRLRYRARFGLLDMVGAGVLILGLKR